MFEKVDTKEIKDIKERLEAELKDNTYHFKEKKKLNRLSII